MAARTFRIGQIVPSSNTTMETEVPAMFRAREAVAPEQFTFHSGRLRMRQVAPEELAAMDEAAERSVAELVDAHVDVLAYACLVAVMSRAPGYHREVERRLHQVTVDEGRPTPVVTSAGALVGGLTALGARRVALVAPYLKPLTRQVVAYLEAEGIEVVDSLSLELVDNAAVGRCDPLSLMDLVGQLRLDGAQAIVLSSCVQLPSLPAIPIVEERTGLPAVSAATCTVFEMLRRLGLPTAIPGAGELLSGRYGAN